MLQKVSIIACYGLQVSRYCGERFAGSRTIGGAIAYMRGLLAISYTSHTSVTRLAAWYTRSVARR